MSKITVVITICNACIVVLMNLECCNHVLNVNHAREVVSIAFLNALIFQDDARAFADTAGLAKEGHVEFNDFIDTFRQAKKTI